MSDFYSIIGNGITSICPKCSSFYEIIDEYEKNIIFKCLCNNEQEQHMEIEKFNDLLKTKKKCYFCQNNFEKLKFCPKCKIIICNKCTNLHTNCINQLFINYDEIGIKCFEHPNDNIECYCDKCKKHICMKCFKNKLHREHKKTYYYGMEPTEKEKDTFIEIRESLKKLEKDFEKEKEDKRNEIENKYKSLKKGLEDKYYNFKKQLNEKIEKIKKTQKIKLKN